MDNNIIAKDRKGNIINIGNIVKSKHGKQYKVLGFLECENQIVVKVDPLEEKFIFRWDKELEVI
jgi:hypothetical protein